MLNFNKKRNISLTEKEDALNIKKICDRSPDSPESLNSSVSVDFETSELTEDTQFDLFKSHIDMKKITFLNSTATVPNYNNIVIYDKGAGPSDVSMTEGEDPDDVMIKEIEDSGDLKQGVLGIFKMLKSIKQDNKDTNKKFLEWSEHVKNNTNNIAILNDNISIQQEQILKNTENVNFIKQSQIDMEVFVAGLPPAVDDKLVMDELVKFYEFDLGTVMSYKSVSITAKIPQKIMNVKFTSKDHQILFLTKVKNKGPFHKNKLDAEADATKKIAIKRRLTKENRDINALLQDLLEKNLIHKVRYRNCFYEFQHKLNSKFVAVPSLLHLDLLNVK